MSDSLTSFEDLAAADLKVGETYVGGRSGTYADEPIHHLLPVGIQGGIRYRGSSDNPQLVVLYSTLTHPHWPDVIDHESGSVTYFGDNQTPGNPLLDTTPSGNRMLHEVFARGFATPADRADCPPFLIFTKAQVPGMSGWSRRFEGLAVPGAADVAPRGWLVAEWFETPSGRFENYRLTLTLLDVPIIERTWLDHVLAGSPLDPSAPIPYRRWVETGRLSVR